MAEIMSVRDFQSNYTRLAPGTSVVIVNASRRKVVGSFTVNEKPEEIERVVRQIFRS
jgi:hypothetical protein